MGRFQDRTPAAMLGFFIRQSRMPFAFANRRITKIFGLSLGLHDVMPVVTPLAKPTRVGDLYS
jgi:hypothetical protein